MSSCSLQSGFALPREPPSPASCLSWRTWLPKTAHWKWGRIYRRTIFPVWCWECKHRYDFRTKSTTCFLWLPNFQKSHRVLGVGTALDMIFGALVAGVLRKKHLEGRPFSKAAEFFAKSEVEGNQTRFFSSCHLKFNIFFQLDCGEVQVPKPLETSSDHEYKLQFKLSDFFFCRYHSVGKIWKNVTFPTCVFVRKR